MGKPHSSETVRHGNGRRGAANTLAPLDYLGIGACIALYVLGIVTNGAF